MFRKFSDWLDDPRECSFFKSIIWCTPKFLSTFTGITAFFAFFIGDFYSEDFPKWLFWTIALLLTMLIGIYYVCSARASKYADPYLKRCAPNEYGAVFYGFTNRNDLSDYSIVEVKKIENGITIPYALAYIDQQDYMNKKLMIVRPFAYYSISGYVAEHRFELIEQEFYSKYVLDYRPLKYNTLRDML